MGIYKLKAKVAILCTIKRKGSYEEMMISTEQDNSKLRGIQE
jgi:hypothetical protein